MFGKCMSYGFSISIRYSVRYYFFKDGGTNYDMSGKAFQNEAIQQTFRLKMGLHLAT